MQFNYQAPAPCPNCKRLKLREIDTDNEPETLIERVSFNTDDNGKLKLLYTCECNVCGFSRTIDKIDPDNTHIESSLMGDTLIQNIMVTAIETIMVKITY